jgi:hypothetical protein
MDRKEIVIKVYNKGEEECEHDFVYNFALRMGFSHPPVVTQLKVCEKCGRAETVQSNEVVEYDNDRIVSAVDKFNLDQYL